MKTFTRLTLCKSISLCLLSFGLAIGANRAHALPGGTIYVCNKADDTVSVISLSTLTVVATIPVGDGPEFVIVTPDGSKAYVANLLGNSVSVIRTSTDSVIATIPVGILPTQIAVSRDSHRVYVANSGSTNISIIDTATDTVLTNVPTGRAAPVTLAFHPIRNEVWVGYNSGTGGGAIEARSATDLSLIARTSSPFIYYASADLAFLPDGTEAYGAEGCGFCGRFNRISGVPSVSDIPVLGPTLFENNEGTARAVAVNPVSGLVYLAKQGQNGGPHLVWEDDREPSPHLIRTNTFGTVPADLAVTSDGKFLFVTHETAAGFVSIVNASNFTTVATVNVGSNPKGIAIKPPLANSEPLAVFNSGTDSNRVVLPFGTIDPHITIIDRTDGLTNSVAYVVQSFIGWLPNDSASLWLSAQPNPLHASNAQWTFRVPIDLRGYAPATACIQARVAADNAILWTRLNGHDVGYARDDSPFVNWQDTLTLTAGFVAGVNYLDFRVADYGAPSGFRIEVSGSAVPSASLNIDVSEVRLCWDSLATKTYQLQYRSELTTNTWANLGVPVLGNGSRLCTTDQVVGPQKYYRVLTLP